MIQFTRDHHVTAHRQLMVFLAKANSELARHHHYKLIMTMPVQIEMGTRWKQGIVGDALSNWVFCPFLGNNLAEDQRLIWPPVFSKNAAAINHRQPHKKKHADSQEFICLTQPPYPLNKPVATSTA